MERTLWRAAYITNSPIECPRERVLRGVSAILVGTNTPQRRVRSEHPKTSDGIFHINELHSDGTLTRVRERIFALVRSENLLICARVPILSRAPYLCQKCTAHFVDNSLSRSPSSPRLVRLLSVLHINLEKCSCW